MYRNNHIHSASGGNFIGVNVSVGPAGPLHYVCKDPKGVTPCGDSEDGGAMRCSGKLEEVGQKARNEPGPEKARGWMATEEFAEAVRNLPESISAVY